MEVNTCLILSAGFGTRMGELTKNTPKPLLPIGDNTILGLQIEYAHMLGMKKAYVNYHHMADQMRHYIETTDFPIEVIPVYEKELLDTGGGIHNIASKMNYSGKLWVMAGDQFLIFDFKRIMEKMLGSCQNACLLAIEVSGNDGYNSLDINDSLLKSITPSDKITEGVVYTYSGLSLINLETSWPRPGVSKFFDTVANFKDRNIDIIKVSDYEYWDFGTRERYEESISRLESDNFFRWQV